MFFFSFLKLTEILHHRCVILFFFNVIFNFIPTRLSRKRIIIKIDFSNIDRCSNHLRIKIYQKLYWLKWLFFQYFHISKENQTYTLTSDSSNFHYPLPNQSARDWLETDRFSSLAKTANGSPAHLLPPFQRTVSKCLPSAPHTSSSPPRGILQSGAFEDETVLDIFRQPKGKGCSAK